MALGPRFRGDKRRKGRSAKLAALSALAVEPCYDVLVLQMEMWAIAYLNGRRMVSIPLARTGDSERRQMLSEYSLVARNEKSSGGVFDNTTS